LPNGDVIGVTTAHSLGKDNFAPVAFVIAGGETVVATFNHLYAPLGTPKSGHNVSIDYVLMQPDAPPDRAIVLQPDSRGAPQPGERISLYSGRGDARDGQRVLHGVVESIDANGVWIRMDGWFDPGGMSGSPVFSQHTGQVVGMIVAVSPRIGTVVIGVNPIGVILDKASKK
jgi:hypothetical protein